MNKNNSRKSILCLLEGNENLSRKEIASRLSLTGAAVTKICTSLIEEGFIVETGTIDGKEVRAGRREITLKINTRNRCVLGINAELDCITFSITKIDGTLIDKKVFNVKQNIKNELDSFLNNQKKTIVSSIIGAAICIVGNDENSEMGIWDYETIKSYLSSKNIEYVIENNVCAFSMAQVLFENNDSSKLFLKWGPGVGSAVVHNGQLVSGRNGEGAEIGHYIVSPGGLKCRCGRYGCLETEVGENAIKEEIGDISKIDELPDKAKEMAYYNLDAKINMVALALANTSVILDSSDIIVFGSMFNIDGVFEKLKKQYLRYTPENTKTNIAISSLNDKSSYIGPCAVAVEKFFIDKA